MILAIDIGNTNIVAALCKGKKIVKELRLSTYASLNPLYYKKAIAGIIKDKGAVNGVIISSVAPPALRIMKKALALIIDAKPLVLGENAKAPIKNKYRNPRQVGQDRLVNALAARCIYGKPAIIVDFGTAVTIDVLSEEGAYLGGVIMPGVELSIENLTSRAALLPRIPLRRPKDILGRSTVESMLSGIFFGYAYMCDGIIEGLKKRLSMAPVVVATGGHSRLLSSYCRNIDKIDSRLTLKGLNLAYSLITEKS